MFDDWYRRTSSLMQLQPKLIGEFESLGRRIGAGVLPGPFAAELLVELGGCPR
jgi:hypothetical protein